jgi:hypothetical protein
MGRAMVLTVKRMSEGRRKKYLHNIVPESGEDRRKALSKIYHAARCWDIF